MLLPALCYAQPDKLGRLNITPASPPDEGIPVFRDHPDKAGIIIESPMTNLTLSRSSNAWRRRLTSFNGSVFRLDFNKQAGYSVRCLKD